MPDRSKRLVDAHRVSAGGTPTPYVWGFTDDAGVTHRIAYGAALAVMSAAIVQADDLPDDIADPNPQAPLQVWWPFLFGAAVTAVVFAFEIIRRWRRNNAWRRVHKD